MTILIATGLKREARLMERPGMVVVAGGADSARLEAELDRLVPGATAILSSGLAGGLDPALRVGDVVIGSHLAPFVSSEVEKPQAPSQAFLDFARNERITIHPGAIAGSGTAILTPVAKAEFRARTGALAVDMESHIAARVAARHGLPFAFLRVISDGAKDVLPPAVLAGMRPDGSVDPLGVIAALLKRPRQLPALIRTARDAGRAMRVLRRCHASLDLTRLFGRA